MAKTKKPRKKRTNYRQRHYTDAERVAAITMATTESAEAAAKKLKIPQRTICAWVTGWRTPQAAQLYSEKKGDLAQSFENIAWECLAVARDKLHEAKFRELMTGAGIATDKMNVLRGKPSAINANVNTNLSVAALLDRMNDEQLETFLPILNALGTTDNGNGSATQTSGARQETTANIRPAVLADPEPRT